MNQRITYRLAIGLVANLAACSIVCSQTTPALQKVTAPPQLQSPQTDASTAAPLPAPLPAGGEAAAASLDRPPWVAKPATPAESVAQEDRLRSAFEYRAASPTPAPTVRLASQQSIGPKRDRDAEQQQTLELKAAKAEKLARSAKTLGDLNDVLELCGFELGSGATRSTRAVDADQCPRAMRTVAAWALNRRGEMRLATGDERTAFEDFQAAIAVDRRCWSAWHNRAVTLAQYGRTEQALTDFAQALELNPRFATAYGNRGKLYYQTGKHELAIQDYTTAIKMGANNHDGLSLADWHWDRSMAYRAMGSSRAAMRDLDRVLQIDPDRHAVYAQRAGLFFDVGYYEAALADYEVAIKQASDGGSHAGLRDAYLGLTWLFAACPDQQFRNPPEAVTAANIAMELSDEVTPQLLDAMAVARAAAGDFTAAIRETQQAILIADEALADELTQRLDLYRRRQAYVLPTVAETP